MEGKAVRPISRLRASPIITAKARIWQALIPRRASARGCSTPAVIDGNATSAGMGRFSWDAHQLVARRSPYSTSTRPIEFDTEFNSSPKVSFRQYMFLKVDGAANELLDRIIQLRLQLIGHIS